MSRIDDTMKQIEQIKRAIETCREPGNYERFMKDVIDYLVNKFPDNVPQSDILDVANFITYRSSIMVNDFMNDYNREMNKFYNEQLKRELKRTKKGD